ncbi:MAG: protein jag [Lachnospiraceae bacterium]|jgi:spoIIIJ-associated protein|nr:protein jag [Lachnospiraceae bacterium]
MDYIEITARTMDDAITKACQELSITSDKLDYVIVEEGSNGFLGLGTKEAIIRAKVKNSIVDCAKIFLREIFTAMKMNVTVIIDYEEGRRDMNIDLIGEEMGVLIGKRGQTLDSLQYLVSLVVNKESKEFIRIKLDTENYRARRQETLENLAVNVATKVKRSRHSVTLEPMNPYERRVIHSILQNDKMVTTYSEGDEPFRRVVIALKRN